MSARTLEQLSSIVSQSAAVISRQLESRNLPSPSLHDIDGPNLREIDSAAVDELANAARELQALAQGPGQQLNHMAFVYHDTSSIGTLVESNIPALVPLEGSITFSDLAAKAGLLEDKLTRILRYAMTNFVFYEPKLGHVAHTALSATLARETSFATFLRTVLVDLAPIAVALPGALRKWPQSETPTECGVNAAFNTDEPFFQWLSRDAMRQARFDEGMAGFSKSDGLAGGRPLNVDVIAYPWGTKLPSNASVVDVGGGSGHVSMSLAEAYPSFSITVQDRPEVVDAIREARASGAAKPAPSNVSYQKHSFFETQPIVGADVYFLRQIMHDWPQKEAVDILRALVPALKPGARVLVSEYIVPAPEELGRPDQVLDAQLIRKMDLQMMAVFNSKERTKEEFASLFAAADPRMRFLGTYQVPEDRKSCIFEAIWEP